MKTKKLHLALLAFATISLQLLTHNAKAQVTFAPAITFAVGTNPSSVISADFNGDGKMDLAIANHGSNNVSILLGNGTGSFGSATNFTTGSGSRSVISADFNGDGKADLAIANDIGNVSILLGNGNGTFPAAVNYSVGSRPESVTVGDFNGDGKVDLV